MNKYVIALVVVLVILGGGVFFISRNQVKEDTYACTLDVKMCPDGGYVSRTGPSCEFQKCPSNPLNDHGDLIKVSYPLPNEIVTSPLVVKGEARGNWFFEASFPVRLYDANGKELLATPAQAKGEWMTTEFVPFEVTLNFTKPTTQTGTLVLQKDNPSGMPEFEDSITIPVRFSP